MKTTYITGTTNADGVLWTDLSLSNIFILSAWFNVGISNVDRFITLGVNNGKYGFLITNTSGTRVASQSVTVNYAYIDL